MSSIRDITPFHYTPKPELPLLVLSCSAEKRPSGRFEWRRFHELYCGPLWLQVAKAGFPWENVAAISALYGFLEPGSPICTYDRVLDEKRCDAMVNTGNDLYRFGKLVESHGSAYVVGGKLYRRLAEKAEEVSGQPAPGGPWPNVAGRIIYCEGTYLEQRKRLGEWLRSLELEPAA